MEISRYEPGTPCWVDHQSADPAGAVAFYSSLFGWEAEDQGEDAGHYNLCRLRGLDAAGIGPSMGPRPAAWTMHVSVDDIEKSAAVVTVRGQVVVEPMDVMEAGRLAICTDSSGAFFALWQPGAHIGARIANEPGAFTWNELEAREPAAALSFYPAVFGWEPKTATEGPGPYTEWLLNGRSIAGMMPMDSSIPPEVPSYWLVYFAVTDTAASVEQATGLGASVVVPPTEIPQGIFAILSDPQGATFAVIAMAS
ncbi:MAG: Glyoxalase/bleomycin resistance protein/dioxygenase [Acidimicrobiaceae bacterium]|nr:Glyoxalase/bleomycin resistance protein/dioxygenase [Acidimicrobiaceae bacterium]